MYLLLNFMFEFSYLILFWILGSLKIINGFVSYTVKFELDDYVNIYILSKNTYIIHQPMLIFNLIINLIATHYVAMIFIFKTIYFLEKQNFISISYTEPEILSQKFLDGANLFYDNLMET